MWQDGQGVARRSRDGKEQAAEGMTKMQHPCSFYIRRLPPLFPPSRRGAKKSPPSPRNPRAVVACFSREPRGAVLQIAFPGGGRCLGTRRMRRPAENTKRQQKKGKVELAFFTRFSHLRPPTTHLIHRKRSPFPRWGRLKNPPLRPCPQMPWFFLTLCCIFGSGVV
jgi:hypothetical protein